MTTKSQNAGQEQHLQGYLAAARPADNNLFPQKIIKTRETSIVPGLQSTLCMTNIDVLCQLVSASSHP